MTLNLGNVRRAFNDFLDRQSRGANNQTQRDIVHLLSALDQRLAASNSIEELFNNSDFELIARVALLVILTCCPNHNSLADQSDVTEIHEISWKLFTGMASISNNEMSSKLNFGRAVFRKQERSSLLGSHGTKVSQHLWKFKIIDSPAVFAEIPESYCHECMVAIFYLLLSDLSGSFSCGAADAIEIPCLIELFRCSDSNNRNCIAALLGEYVGFVQVCLREDFTYPVYTAKSDAVKFDFSILKNGTERYYYSVKSVSFSGTQYFDSERRDTRTSGETKLVDDDGSNRNVLLHDCHCTFCKQNSVWKIKVINVVSDDDSDDEGSGDTSPKKVFEGFDTFLCKINKENFHAIFVKSKIRFGVIYLVAAPTFFDLRHAVTTIDQTKLRGKNFHLRNHIIEILSDIATNTRGGSSGALAWEKLIRTLIPRNSPGLGPSVASHVDNPVMLE